MCNENGYRSRRTMHAMTTGVVAAISMSAAADIWHVDASITTSGDGTDWGNGVAFKTLDEGLAAASSPQAPPIQIWVAAGTYKTSTRLDSSDARSAVFQLVPGVEIYGGFVGTESTLAERDHLANPTILSGEIGTAAVTDNVYHVVYGTSSLDSTARLDGFVITRGNADGSGRIANTDRGGGMLILSGEPVIVRCSFVDNLAAFGGGGAFLATAGTTSQPFNFINCTFQDNFTNVHGGGLRATGSFETGDGNVRLANCLFVGNEANFHGGGIGSVSPGAALRIVNCTFTENVANADLDSLGDGGGLLGAAVISNSIFWANLDGTVSTTQAAQLSGPAATDVDHTCIQGLTGPFSINGNIGSDPDFRNPAADDYQLDDASPCIDAAGNGNVPFDSFDIDADGILMEQLPFDVIDRNRFARDSQAATYEPCFPPVVDMGAFERADCNGNGVDDAVDIAQGADDDNEDGIPDACQDCNENEVPDPVDISEGTSQDCNGNGVPDECDAPLGCAADVNQNDVPDECECPLDLVFIVDHSDSMLVQGELAAICDLVNDVTADLQTSARLVRAIITASYTGTLDSCDVTSYEDLTGQTHGCDPDFWDWEDWGVATAAISQHYDWLPRGLRVIIPISDEGPCRDDGPCNQDDTDSINEAILAAIENEVLVLPIAGVDATMCFFERTTDGGEHAVALADQTGGSVYEVGSSASGYATVADELTTLFNDMVDDCLVSCTGDINGDSVVNGIDLGILLANWSIPAGTPGCQGELPCPSDINEDGVVDGIDLGNLLANWLCGSESMQFGGESMQGTPMGGGSAFDDLWTVLTTSVEEFLDWWQGLWSAD